MGVEGWSVNISPFYEVLELFFEGLLDYEFQNNDGRLLQWGEILDSTTPPHLLLSLGKC